MTEQNNFKNFDITTAHRQPYMKNDLFGIQQNNSEDNTQDKFVQKSANYLKNNSRKDLTKIKQNFKNNETLLKDSNNKAQNIKQIRDILIRDNQAESNIYSLLNNLYNVVEASNYDYINKRLINKKDKRGIKELLIKFSNDLSHDYYDDAMQFQLAKNKEDNMINKLNNDIDEHPNNVEKDKKLINSFIQIMNKKLDEN